MRRLGIDAVGVERIAVAIRRSGTGFLRKAFTPAELDECGADPERLAGRWAGKEAVIKCLDGTGLCFPRRQIEILPNPAGAPRVRLLGEDGRRAQIELSITHHSGLAVAAALLEMADPEDLLLAPPATLDLPDRPLDGHKGTFGTVVVLAGSFGLTGAAYLSSMAAARAGAGLVRLLVAESIYSILATKCTEVMATPIPEVAPGHAGHAQHDVIARRFEDAKAALVGPGLGRDRSTWRLAVELALELGCPTVLDADALNALAESRRALERLPRNRVLTPHPGEMSRLTGLSLAEVLADRSAVARDHAARWGCVVVLKGAHTVVAGPDGELSVDPHQVPALASGGTGDVLGGVIAAFLAQGLDPFTAAVSGVYVHAAAGRRIEQRLGPAGLLASDLLDEVPIVMKVLREGHVAAPG